MTLTSSETTELDTFCLYCTGDFRTCGCTRPVGPTHDSWTGVTSHPGSDSTTCALCIAGLEYEAMAAEASR